MASEEEDTKMRLEDSGRKAEEEMAKLVEQATQGEVEEPEEVEETDEKADSETGGEQEKTPEEDSATTTLPDDKNVTTANVDSGKAIPEGEEKASKEGEAPQEDEKAPEEEKDEVDKEIDSVNLRKDAHPKTQKALGKVKTIAKEEHKARKVAEKRIQELEAEKSTIKVLDEPTEKELQELRNFRRAADIENDPEITDKYDKRIETTRNSVQSAIEASNIIPAGTLQFIKDNGGILKFRTSTQFVPTKDAAGNALTKEDGTPMTQSEFWQTKIAPFLPPAALEDINLASLQVRQIELERAEKISEAKKDVEGFYKSRQEQAQTQNQEFKDRFNKRAEVYVKTLGDVAVKKEYPPNATREQIAAVDKHNARRDKAERETLYNRDNLNTELLADALLDHAHVSILKTENKEQAERITELEKQVKAGEQKLDAFKNAGKTSNKQSASTTTKEKPKSIYGQDSETYMMEEMRKAGIA